MADYSAYTETTAGLPNTCANCGADPGKTWYAANADAAIAGAGVCPGCKGVKDERVLRPQSAAGAETQEEAERSAPVVKKRGR